jgi:PilZ domain
VSEMTGDRRRNPRVAILGKLHGHVVTLDVAVTVLEISLGGMGIQTTVPFPVDAVHSFQLTLGDNSVVHLKGRIAHCQRLAGEEDRYVSGVQFIDEAADDE